MALKVYSLASLAEIKQRFPIQGTTKDDALEQVLGAASLAIERYLDRRLIFRAPLEVPTADNTVLEVPIVDGALAIASQPNASGRTFVVTVTDANRTITAGKVTITGTVAGVAGVTEVFDLVNGLVQQGVKFFTAVSTIQVSGMAGQEAADKVKIGTSLGYVEYHTVWPGDCYLFALERPIQQVAEVNEDVMRAYGVSTKLVEGTDFEVSVQLGRLTRVSARLPWLWWGDYRAVKLVYSAGYQNRSLVSADVKDVAMRLAALLYQEAMKEQLGRSGMSDPSGNWTRFGPSTLTNEMKAELSPHIRAEIFHRTGERDFDPEAA